MKDRIHTLRRAFWHLRNGSLRHFIEREREKAGKSSGKRGIVSTVLPVIAQHQLRPAQALALEASKLLSEGRFEGALEKASQAVLIEKGLMKAHYDRIRILARMGLIDDARNLSSELLAQFPIDVGLVRTAHSVGFFPETLPLEDIYQIIGAAKDRLTAALKAMEYCYFFGRFADALHFYNVGYAVAHREKRQGPRERLVEKLDNWRALSLEGLTDYKAALDAHRILVLRSSKPHQHVAGMARCLLEMERPHEATQVLLASTDEPLALPRFTSQTMDLFQASGRIADAYALYRRRPVSQAIAKQFGMPDPSELNILSGAYKDKRVMLISEGGPGDEMRFSSFYPELREHFGDITITCDPRMKPALDRSFQDIRFVAARRWRRDIERSVPDRSRVTDPLLYQCVTDDVIDAGQGADLVCSVLDLLEELRPDRESFRHRDRAFIEPDRSLAVSWSRQISVDRRRRPVRIGVAWRSMLRSVARDRHYFDVSELRDLSQLDGVEFWSLQPSLTEAELCEARKFIDLRVPEGLDLIEDLEGQFAFCSNLDFIVAPFNTTGEMGGALGVPTFLLATTGNTIWRQSPDGSDLFSARTQIVRAERLHDKAGCMASAAYAIAQAIEALPSQRQRGGGKAKAVA